MCAVLELPEHRDESPRPVALGNESESGSRHVRRRLLLCVQDTIKAAKQKEPRRREAERAAMNSVVLFVVLFSAVFAAPDLVFYVSSVHGNDSNAGSLLAPLRSLSGVGAAVASSSRAVDVILFAGERFDSCGESLSVAGSLRLHGNGSSVSCAQRNATAGLVLSSSGATLELRDESFVDFECR
jgi:hypothetical protein